MAKVSVELAYKGIYTRILKDGGSWGSWYVGITKDIEKRLHGDHRVSKSRSGFIYYECLSSGSARKVEDLLIKKGCAGGDGGGDNATVFVYAYKKTASTNP